MPQKLIVHFLFRKHVVDSLAKIYDICNPTASSAMILVEEGSIRRCLSSSLACRTSFEQAKIHTCLESFFYLFHVEVFLPS